MAKTPTKTKAPSDLIDDGDVMERESIREEARAPARETVRKIERPNTTNPDELVAYTAEGVEIRRASYQQTTPGEAHNVPPEERARGFRYEWKNAEVHGQEQREHMLELKRNGWREVPSERHPNYPTRRMGAVLMELPEMWARESDQRDQIAAGRQRAASADLAPALAPGFTQDHPGARNVTFARRSLEGADPALKPKVQLAVDD